ncbi:MAG: hypothetical protein SVR94_09215, partial [Pseudomonadota bacterium]|nr:hypothetical protein [Pseudomonadota bacterium]
MAKGRINAIGALLASCLLTVSLFTGTIDTNTFYRVATDQLMTALKLLSPDGSALHINYTKGGIYLHTRRAADVSYDPIYLEPGTVIPRTTQHLKATFTAYTQTTP